MIKKPGKSKNKESKPEKEKEAEPAKKETEPAQQVKKNSIDKFLGVVSNINFDIISDNPISSNSKQEEEVIDPEVLKYSFALDTSRIKTSLHKKQLDYDVFFDDEQQEGIFESNESEGFGKCKESNVDWEDNAPVFTRKRSISSKKKSKFNFSKKLKNNIQTIAENKANNAISPEKKKKNVSTSLPKMVKKSSLDSNEEIDKPTTKKGHFNFTKKIMINAQQQINNDDAKSQISVTSKKSEKGKKVVPKLKIDPEEYTAKKKENIKNLITELIKTCIKKSKSSAGLKKERIEAFKKAMEIEKAKEPNKELEKLKLESNSGEKNILILSLMFNISKDFPPLKNGKQLEMKEATEIVKNNQINLFDFPLMHVKRFKEEVTKYINN